jgi:dipeptidyl aminopeptidase/acylaminoacyl peptidase
MAATLALGLASCLATAPAPARQGHGASTGQARPPRATPGPSPDGAILSLDLVLRSERSEYFALTYWSDGLRVRGFLGRPRSGGLHPAVIWNRGGNREYGALEGWEIIPFVEAGFVTVASQYRGNGGSEGREAFGGADLADVMSLVPLLEQRPEVDPERIGMIGRSRGGMMTYLALAEQARRGTHAIKVAVTVGGVADLEDLLDERPELVREVYLPLIGATPWREPEAYRARSAVFWPERLTVPLLLLHGEADEAVPVRQSRRLAELAQVAGRPVQLVTFPGDDHALSANRFGLPPILEWLGRQLGREGDDHSYGRHQAEIAETLKAWWKMADGPEAAPE